MKDGENYTILLNQLAPDLCSRAPLRENDLFSRAEQVLQNAEKLNCRKYLSPQSLVAGNPKLNLAFVANLFNTHPGLDPLEEVERPELPDVEGDREARGTVLLLAFLFFQLLLALIFVFGKLIECLFAHALFQNSFSFVFVFI